MAYDKYEHFVLEKKLADELRGSTLDQRRTMYNSVYTKLFSTFPELSHNLDQTEADRIDWQVKLVKRLFDKNKVFMEIGAGDCILSKALAPHFKKIIAYEVANSIPFIEGRPDNLELRIFNGFDMDAQPESVDIVYSNQVFEHLHPDDTLPLLQKYHSFLKKDGNLVVITPHILTGPHDISRDFTPDPQGFHLKEYTYKELRDQLKQTGFHKIKAYAGYSKWGYFPISMSLLIMLEKMGNGAPKFLRKKLKTSSLAFNLFGMKVIATKK
jgi:SAM-dependent methyltransferase